MSRTTQQLQSARNQSSFIGRIGPANAIVEFRPLSRRPCNVLWPRRSASQRALLKHKTRIESLAKVSLDRRSHINDIITAPAHVSSLLAVVRFLNFTVCDSFICDCKERCLEVLASAIASGATCAKEQRKSFTSVQLVIYKARRFSQQLCVLF